MSARRAASPRRRSGVRVDRSRPAPRAANGARAGLLDGLVGPLKRLKLSGLAKALEIQEARGDTRAFLVRLNDLVGAELQRRADRGLSRRLCAAELPETSAVLADAWVQPGRGFGASDVSAWASARWVGKGRNLLITGRPGTGRTWLACAVANAAASEGHTVKFWDAPDLLLAWFTAVEHNVLKAFKEKLLKVDLLVLDLWGCERVDEEDATALRRALEPRLKAGKSVLVASNLPPDTWPAWLGGSDLAESLTRKLVAPAQWVELKVGRPQH